MRSSKLDGDEKSQKQGSFKSGWHARRGRRLTENKVEERERGRKQRRRRERGRKKEEDGQFVPRLLRFDSYRSNQGIRVSCEVLSKIASVSRVARVGRGKKEAMKRNENGEERERNQGKRTLVPLCITISAPHLQRRVRAPSSTCERQGKKDKTHWNGS
jgi:hypothetical protein